MSKRHSEILEIHPSVALWLQNKKWLYSYECWLNINNRIDFLARDWINDKMILCEVGNHYDDAQHLTDKFIQCDRYHQLFPSYDCFLFLPNDYHEHDDFVNYYAKLYNITVIYIEIHDFIDNYDEFMKIIYPFYTDETNPNIGYFKRF